MTVAPKCASLESLELNFDGSKARRPLGRSAREYPVNVSAMSGRELAFSLIACMQLAACLFETGEPDHPDPGVSPALVSAANPASANEALLPSHLPCAVESIVRTRCKSCHSPASPLHQVSLLTYADFAQASKSLPTSSYAQQAQQLIASGMMPPTSALGPADVQAFSAWVQAGAPPAECGLGADAGAGIAIADAGAFDAGIGLIPDAGPFDAGFPGPGLFDAGFPDASEDDAASAPGDPGHDAGRPRCVFGIFCPP